MYIKYYLLRSYTGITYRSIMCEITEIIISNNSRSVFVTKYRKGDSVCSGCVVLHCCQDYCISLGKGTAVIKWITVIISQLAQVINNLPFIFVMLLTRSLYPSVDIKKVSCTSALHRQGVVSFIKFMSVRSLPAPHLCSHSLAVSHEFFPVGECSE